MSIEENTGYRCDNCPSFEDFPSVENLKTARIINFRMDINLCESCLIKAIKTVRPIPENTKYLKYMFNKNAFEEKTMHEFIDWLEPFLEEKEK